MWGWRGGDWNDEVGDRGIRVGLMTMDAGAFEKTWGGVGRAGAGAVPLVLPPLRLGVWRPLLDVVPSSQACESGVRGRGRSRTEIEPFDRS